MGTIEKRGKNSWRIGERLPTYKGRKWIRRTLTYPATMPQAEQRRAAELELARLMVELADGEPVPEREFTVRELADIWLHTHVEEYCKPTTETTYRALLNVHILPVIGDTLVSELTPLDLQRLVNTIRATEKRTTAKSGRQGKRPANPARPDAQPALLSDKTVRHCYDVMNYMFNKGVKWKIIKHNPLDDVDRPRARRRKIKSLDDEQAVELLRKLSGESLSFRCAVLLALLCGLRLSEVGGLRLSDVDWKNCSINVTQALHYVPGRGNYMDTTKSEAGERVISLPAGMMALLDAARKEHEEFAFFFGDEINPQGIIVTGQDGQPLHHDTPSKQFRRFADRNGFEGVRFHDLRHTHASILLANNLDAVAVAARMGHESPETTLRNYAHALQRRDKESAAAMQQLLDRAAQKENVPTDGDKFGDT